MQVNWRQRLHSWRASWRLKETWARPWNWKSWWVPCNQNYKKKKKIKNGWLWIFPLLKLRSMQHIFKLKSLNNNFARQFLETIEEYTQVLGLIWLLLTMRRRKSLLKITWKELYRSLDLTTRNGNPFFIAYCSLSLSETLSITLFTEYSRGEDKNIEKESAKSLVGCLICGGNVAATIAVVHYYYRV